MADKIRIYNKRMEKFKSNFTKEELFNFGENKGLRVIPQIM